MKRFSIRLQLLLIVMIPVLLIDSLLTWIHINSELEQEENLLRSKAIIVAEQVANASEFNLLSGNYAQIQTQLSQTINSNNILHAAVYDEAEGLIAKAENKAFKAQLINEYLFHRQVIFTQVLGSSDIFDPDDYVEEAEIQRLGSVHLYISRKNLDERQRQIINDGLFLFITTLVVALLLTLAVSERITRPIFKLREHLNSIEKGNLGDIIEQIESNEIGDVQKGFNSMSVALLANRMDLNDRINTATQALKEANADLTNKNLELAEARDQAQNADQVKSQFLANISHEIRTPINGIKGFINLLSHSGLRQEQKRYANIIKQSTQDLSRIINEVLDLAKIESGKIEMHKEAFDLYELVETTRDSLFTVAMEKGIDLFLIIYSDTPQDLVGDASRIKQILINLIGNAIKFTDDGFVSIKVYQDQKQNHQVNILFEIQDSGIGIPAAHHVSLFEAFKQIESDDNRQFSGTGLGLTIAKNLCNIMGGDISVESDSGSGSFFTVSIPLELRDQFPAKEPTAITQSTLIYSFDPLAQQELQSLFDRLGFDTHCQLIAPGTELLQLKNEINDNASSYQTLVIDLRHSFLDPRKLLSPSILAKTKVKLLHYDPAFVESELLNDYDFISVINTSNNLRLILEGQPDLIADKNTQSVPAVETRKVLIVDDNRINLTLAKELVELWGHHAFAAMDADEALALFNEETFDLILLDIQMPKIDGIQLMEIMRQQQPILKTPIVALTANVMALEKQRLLTAGFDAYLGKPIDEEELHLLLEGQHNSFDKKELYPLNPADQAVSIEHELTLKLSGNNKKLARDVYNMLANELPDYSSQLKNAIDHGNSEELSLIIHKLEGVTCHVGLPRLKQLLSEYALSKKTGDDPKYLKAQAIRQELIEIREELDDYIDSRNSA